MPPADSNKPRRAPPRRATRRPARDAGPAAVRAAAREIASGVYRDAILAAAHAEFTERGFGATKIVDVARRAGMSVGALYRYFDSKEAIFVSLIHQAGEQYLDRLEGIDRALPLADRLRAMVTTTLTFLEENRGMFLLFSQVRDDNVGACAALHDHVTTLRDRGLAVYRAALADGIEAGLLTDEISLDDQTNFFSGTMHGFIEAWMFGDASWRLVDKADLITRLALRALGGAP